MLDRLEWLPRPQCDVLVVAFGPAAGQRQIVLWQGWLS